MSRVRFDRVAAGRLLAGAAIFLIVLGAKLALIVTFTKPHPYWDSWHVEGAQLYKPYLTGALTVADLFSPASEHRPVVLRVYDLALLSLNGQWDVQLQMVVNAVLFAALGCLLFRLLARDVGPLATTVIAAAIAVFLAVPSGWENTLNGHHAGWFFFYLCSIGGLWLTLARPPLSGPWLAGYACLVASYFSLFAGVISIVTAAGGLALMMLCRRVGDRRTWAALALLVATFIVGMIYEPRFPGQATVQAHSVRAFFTALGYALSWPHFEIGARGLLLQVPTVLLALLVLARRITWTPRVGFVVALAVWVWLQAVGIAYARGVDGMPPVVRYMDILTLGLLAGLTAAVILVVASGPSMVRRLPALALLCAWLVSAGVGIELRTRDAYIGMLPEKQRVSATQEGNLRAFVATNDRVHLDNKSAADIAYYGGAPQVAAFLTDPVIRPILPSTIAQPLSVQWAAGAGQPVAAPVTPEIAVEAGAASTGAAAEVRIESGWLPPPDLPFLQFRLAGQWDQPGMSVAVVPKSGAPVVLHADGPAGAGWVSAEIPSPHRPFRIEAVDASATGWVAVAPPRPMGRLSFYAQRLAQRARFILWLGYFCAILAIAAQGVLLASRSRSRAGG